METNKIIAQFMGGYEPEEFEDYDTSWNWLMPVVEKILNLDGGIYNVLITERQCRIYSDDNSYNDSCDLNTTLESVYQAVVRFIERNVGI